MTIYWWLGGHFQNRVSNQRLSPHKIVSIIRCVAGDKTSHCAMRNMMACTVTGQGAGTAAAVSIKVKTIDNLDRN